MQIISTHTPLAGRDGADTDGISVQCISTHTPLAGRDAGAGSIFNGIFRFLLTRPSRDVTEGIFRLLMKYCISTHTPLAGRDHG